MSDVRSRLANRVQLSTFDSSTRPKATTLTKPLNATDATLRDRHISAALHCFFISDVRGKYLRLLRLSDKPADRFAQKRIRLRFIGCPSRSMVRILPFDHQQWQLWHARNIAYVSSPSKYLDNPTRSWFHQCKQLGLFMRPQNVMSLGPLFAVALAVDKPIRQDRDGNPISPFNDC